MSFTRDFASTVTVPCLDQVTFDGSCAASGSSAPYFGKIVDRLAFNTRYNAAMPVVLAQADLGTSTALSRYAAVTAKIQHSNTTSTSAAGATGWNDLTTSYQSCEQALFIITNTTATSTAGNAAGYLSTSLTASTSTGQATGAAASAWYPLDNAQQFVRIVVTPRLEGSSSGGTAMQLVGALVFGEPQYAVVGSPIQANNLGGGVPVSTSTGIVVRTTAT